MRITLAALMTVALLTATSQAAIFTWTGGAGAGSNWYDTGNWAGGNVPITGTQLATTSSADQVVFDSENVSYMPTDTITTRTSWTGGYKNPTIDIRNGTVKFASGLNWGWSGIDTFIIGDGDMTTLAVANTGYSNLNRDPNGVKTYVVNADGALNVSTTLTKWADNNNTSGKRVVVKLVGGAMSVNGTVNSNLTDGAPNYVTFNALGSTFTAKFGGQLPDEATITGQFNDSFRLGGSLASDPDAELTYTNNQDGTFTVGVQIIPEPASMVLLGLGGLMLARRRRA
jgi:hypothetical protein